MARKRQGTISESADQLAELASRHNGRQQEARIRMLLLLQQDSSRTVVQAADMIHCSERTVRRWWKIYQEQGLESLLSGNDLPAPRSADVPSLRMNGWNSQDALFSGQMADFLNALPMKSDTDAWIEQFRTALGALLGDVDRIMIDINLNPGADPAPGRDPVSSLNAQGFPVEKYHQPHIIDYHTEDGSYIGTIILWREEWKREISQRSIRTLSQLKPFLIFALSDCVARGSLADTRAGAFADAAPATGERTMPGLRDREPLLHQLPRKQFQDVAAVRYPGASAA